MKVKLIACLSFLSICAGNVFPQKISKKEYSIYSEILGNRDTPKFFFVNKYTSNTDLKKFNFKDPRYYITDGSQIKAISDTSWKNFLSKIDTGTFLDHQIIKNKFKGEYKVILFGVFNPKKHLIPRELTPDTDEIIRSITFSNVQFSKNNDKAVCTVKTTSSVNYSCGMYFLEYVDGRWKVIKVITLYLS